MDISLGRRFLLTSVKYGIPTYLSLPSLKVSCPNPPPPMRNSRKQLKQVDLWGGGGRYQPYITLYQQSEGLVSFLSEKFGFPHFVKLLFHGAHSDIVRGGMGLSHARSVVQGFAA